MSLGGCPETPRELLALRVLVLWLKGHLATAWAIRFYVEMSRFLTFHLMKIAAHSLIRCFRNS